MPISHKTATKKKTAKRPAKKAAKRTAKRPSKKSKTTQKANKKSKSTSRPAAKRASPQAATSPVPSSVTRAPNDDTAGITDADLQAATGVTTSSSTPPSAASSRKPDRNVVARRRRQALELRKSGLSYHVISKSLGVSETTARRDVDIALKTTIGTDDLSQPWLELERLEMACSAIARSVRDGDHASIDRWLRLSDARRKILDQARKSARSSMALPFKVFVDVEIERV